MLATCIVLNLHFRIAPIAAAPTLADWEERRTSALLKALQCLVRDLAAHEPRMASQSLPSRNRSVIGA